MLDPEVVRRLRISAEALREVLQESPRAREFCDGLADDIEALLADWERRGEALRNIIATGTSSAAALKDLARAALEGGKP